MPIMIHETEDAASPQRRHKTVSSWTCYVNPLASKDAIDSEEHEASKVSPLSASQQYHTDQIFNTRGLAVDNLPGASTPISGKATIMGGHMSHIVATRCSSDSDGPSTPDSDQAYMELESATEMREDNFPGIEAEDLDYKIPIVGYEVMEERARFTVFRIQVEQKGTGKNWFVFRRYTDFTRLNRKLKALFPGLRLSLPPKRWFGDNFDPVFLEDRLLGLQAFVNNIISHKEIGNSHPIREFFCLDDPPGRHDTIEESMAFCETLEQTIERMNQEVKVRDASIQLLRTEIGMLQSQQDALLKSLKLECSLMAQVQELLPKVCSCQQKERNPSDDEGISESFHTCSCRSQILRLHHMNMDLVNMVEKSVMTPGNRKLPSTEEDIDSCLDTELQKEAYTGSESQSGIYRINCSCLNGAACLEHSNTPSVGERPSPLGESNASSPTIEELAISGLDSDLNTSTNLSKDVETLIPSLATC